MVSVEAPPDGRAGITAELARRLVGRQFPQWANLPVAPVRTDGWDNRTYRLGDFLTVRLPTHARYADAVAKEDRWLPVLAPHLPLPVPEVVATGEPDEGYSHPWSVRRWLDGRPVRRDDVDDLPGFARDLAAFARALWAVDTAGGPAAGRHSFHRGCPPVHYDAEVRASLHTLGEAVDQATAAAVWQRAIRSAPSGPPVWFHGDLAPGNLLVDHRGRLSAVIDFGTAGVGDPACDLVIAWTLLDQTSRAVFAEAAQLDPGTWARARGWALWKALLMAAELGVTSAAGAEHLRVAEEVLADRLTLR